MRGILVTYLNIRFRLITNDDSELISIGQLRMLGWDVNISEGLENFALEIRLTGPLGNKFEFMVLKDRSGEYAAILTIDASDISTYDDYRREIWALKGNLKQADIAQWNQDLSEYSTQFLLEHINARLPRARLKPKEIESKILEFKRKCA